MRAKSLGSRGSSGAGRSEVAAALFGLEPPTSGQHSSFAAARCASERRREAIELGIGLVPEDRKRQGLVLSESGAAQHVARRSSTGSRASAGSISAKEREVAQRVLSTACACARRASTSVVAGLSGGNQQKIVLAQWLAAKSKILILDEPTRGVDVGAKAEIHALIGELAAQGAAILLISSELPELLSLSERILVLRAGRMVGEVARAEANQERLLRLMAGLT